MKRRRALLALPLLSLGCASAPQTPTAAAEGGFRPPAQGGRLWRADAARSRLRIVAFRAGAAARLGHHHLLEAPRFAARLWLPEQGLDGAQAELSLRIDELELDRPEWRQAAGGEFDEKPLDAAAIAATRANLLNALQAQAHPELRIRLLGLAGAAPWWLARVRVELAGRPSDYELPLQVEAQGQDLQLQGRLLLRHSAHGLQAFSVLGGLLAMRDEVLLDFRLALLSVVPAGR